MGSSGSSITKNGSTFNTATRITTASSGDVTWLAGFINGGFGQYPAGAAFDNSRERVYRRRGCILAHARNFWFGSNMEFANKRDRRKPFKLGCDVRKDVGQGGARHVGFKLLCADGAAIHQLSDDYQSRLLFEGQRKNSSAYLQHRLGFC